MKAIKRRKRRKNKALNAMIQQVHEELIAEGVIEQLPGGFVRLTPAGAEAKKQLVDSQDFKTLMSVSDKAQAAARQKNDLRVKQAILQSTRRIVG